MNQKSTQQTVALSPKKHYLLYLLFIIIAFVFYGNSIKNGYSLDDELVTSTYSSKNPLVENGISGIVKIFQSRFANDGEQTYAYRPITTLSFAIEHSIVGESDNTAQISHFVSVMLYGVCGILLFLFLMQLFKGEARWFAAIVVVLYLIHPIHTEIVDNIKTRDELLAMIFCLGATINVFKYYDHRKLKFLFLAAFLLCLGLLSRPSAKVFIGLIPLTLYFFRDIKLKTLALYFAGIVVCLVLLKLFTKAMIEVPSVRNFEYFENPLRFLSFSHRIPMFFYTTARYILILIIPYPLKYFYGYNDFPMIGFGDWEFYVSLVLVAVLLYFAWKGLKQKTVLSFSILAFFFGIGGVANLLSPAAGIFAERFANFASIGFVMTIVLLIFKWQKWDVRSAIPSHKKNTVYGTLIVIAIPTLLYVTNRNNDWKGKINLFRADMPKLKNSTKAHSLLATEYMFNAMDLIKSNNISLYERALKQADSAHFHFRRSVEIFPEYTSSWNNLAVYQFNFMNDYDSAIVLSKKAITIDSTYKQGYFNLGNCYAKTTVLYQWMIADNTDSTKIRLSSEELYAANQIINTSKIKKAIVPMMKIESMAERLKNKAVPLNQIVGFAQYIKTVSEQEGKYLPPLKLSSYIERLKSMPQNQKSQYITLLFKKVRTYFMNEIQSILPEKYRKSNLLYSIFNQNIANYSDSAFLYFNQLYRIDPKYGQVYEAAFSFSKVLMNIPKMLKWGNRYKKAFPDLPSGMMYLQIAYAYFVQHNREKSVHYYNLSLGEFKAEIRHLRRLEKQTDKQKKMLINLQKQAQSVSTFLVNAKDKPDSTFFNAN